MSSTVVGMALDTTLRAKERRNSIILSKQNYWLIYTTIVQKLIEITYRSE